MRRSGSHIMLNFKLKASYNFGATWSLLHIGISKIGKKCDGEHVAEQKTEPECNPGSKKRLVPLDYIECLPRPIYLAWVGESMYLQERNSSLFN